MKPREWDRNFNDRAFEVIDESGKPVLQIYYKTANEIVINGMFRVGLSMVYVSEESGIRTQELVTREGKVSDEKPPPPSKIMFRYPSLKHQGEFSPDWKPITY